MTVPGRLHLSLLRDVSEPRFRDPPARAPELKLRLARVLANADRLPIEIPRTSLSLIDIEGNARAIDLVFGAPDEVARIRLEKGPGETAVRGSLEIHAGRGVERDRVYLNRATERLAAATTEQRWDEATSISRELSRAPRDVPMTFLRQFIAGVARPTGLVRVGFQCNQDCGICWQGRDWGRYDAGAILDWIEDLARAGAEHLMISGGEPTLDKSLVDYVARAKELGFERITIETNAILATRDALASRLASAGLHCAFVSLHSADAATSDAITRAPGTHARTIAGIHALLAANVDVQLNAVMTKEGLEHLVGLPDFIAREFGTHPRLGGLMLSYPTAPFDRTLSPSIIPTPEALRSVLRATIDRAAARGIRLEGLDGPCGPPLCAFGADPRVTALSPATGPVSFRRFLAPCEQCSVKSACLGVQEVAATMFGDDAVRPLAMAP